MKQYFNTLFNKKIEIVQILEELQIQVDDFIIIRVIATHFVEHLLRLQDEIHQVDNLESMRNHLYFSILPHFCLLTVVSNGLIRFYIYANFL